ncbi:MAG TPA: metalloregulator ArsR/SmtB family transcription factor [Acidimicrobiales bacterium]|nr:metalloregulator ArsR/SmtB family transcription factor [Acidimicrobiales bacterium]
MRDVQKVIAALGSPVRRDILALVWDRELPAGEIAAAFDVTKPTISQHLAVLREAGLVSLTPAGTSRRYRAQPAALAGLRGALSGSTKWTNVEDAPERSLAEAYTKPLVAASVEVPTDQATTFRAFTDPDVYTRWLGVPVTIDDGTFACTMEWGTHVRGRYEVVSPPELLALRWDFEDDAVPVPGGEMTGYVRFTSVDEGTRVEVHQIVDTGVQAEFMEGAWTLVLGRLRSGIVRALEPGVAAPARPTRPKRRRSA